MLLSNITVDNGNWVNFTLPNFGLDGENNNDTFTYSEKDGENNNEYPAEYDHLYENLPYDYEYEKEWLDHYDIDKIYVIGVI